MNGRSFFLLGGGISQTIIALRRGTFANSVLCFFLPPSLSLSTLIWCFFFFVWSREEGQYSTVQYRRGPGALHKHIRELGVRGFAGLVGWATGMDCWMDGMDGIALPTIGHTHTGWHCRLF
jgi:hypothetical protein